MPTVMTRKIKQRVRRLGEALDGHRKARQAACAGLTLTDMYNVLEKVKAGEPLNAKEQRIHLHGQIGELKRIHEELDAAVFDAYGWPHDLTDEQILERLVALNHERAEEERQGLIRWLRPEYQIPLYEAEHRRKKAGKKSGHEQRTLEAISGPPADDEVKPVKKLEWPKGLTEQYRAIIAALRECGRSVAPDELAKRFNGARRQTVAEALDSCVITGIARRTSAGRYAASVR